MQEIDQVYTGVQYFKVPRVCIYLLAFLLAFSPGMGLQASQQKKAAQTTQELPNLTILTENFAPLNFVRDNQVTGFVTDLMVNILENLNAKQSRKDIIVMPWARAYQLTLVRPNTVLFAMTYTEQRDMLFRWVGPIMPNRVAIVAKKSRKIRVQYFEELEGLIIGTVRDDVGEQLLVAQGVEINNLISNTDVSYVTKMLMLGRIDAMSYSDLGVNWYLQELGEKLTDYEVVYVLQESAHYLAFSRNTPKWVTDKFQEALMRIKFSDRFQLLAAEYPAIEYALSQQENNQGIGDQR